MPPSNLHGHLAASDRRSELAYMFALGIAGWTLLAVAGQLSQGSVAAQQADWPPVAMFATVIVLARGMAFELMPRTVISVDAAFYVAAGIVLGPVSAGRLVAFALTVDPLLRLVGMKRHGSGRSRLSAVAYVIYFGGMTGALLTIIGWLFQLGGDPALLSHGAVLGRVVGVGALLLVAHYTLTGTRQVLAGRRLGAYIREMALPGIVGEATLLPLAAVLVLVYRPGEPLGFALIGATYLLINFGFNRLSGIRDVLRKRVSELETLNATARSLSSSLRESTLVASVASETLRAIPEADCLVLARRVVGAEPAGEFIQIERLDRGAAELVVTSNRTADGATPDNIDWVLEHEQALSVAPQRGADGGAAATPSSAAAPGSWLGVPVVMYGNVEGALAVQSHERGAFGVEQIRLLESISAQVAVALQNAHLYELAMVDGLTGLFVRRYFDARLDEEVKRSARFDVEFSVVMMDVDDFKKLNDTYGHTVGDRVLREVAAIVRAEMRGVDTAARYGGEEFSMILPRTELVSAYNQAERIRQHIEALEISVEGVIVRVTASFGIAAYQGGRNARDCGVVASAENLVRSADRALYRAKQTGKNRVELYWSDDDDASRRSSVRSV